MQLIEERNSLFEKMNNYENAKMLLNQYNFDESFVKPSLDTVYYWNNFYLKVVTDLIIENLTKTL